MTGFVLVHGGLHGAWCWQRVIEPLGQAGHDVIAVDLPGRDGENLAALTMDDYVQAIREGVEKVGPSVTLVGHSLGGVFVSQYAERFPATVDQIILVNALLVENGEAALPKLQAAGAGCALLEPGVLCFSADDRSVRATGEQVAAAFYGSCSSADAAWAVQQLCPEPLAALMTPLPISETGFGSMPKHYVASRADRVLPLELQLSMAKACGADLVVLDGDHSPLLSAPEQLVSILLSTAGAS